ncbi:hypothetical protein HID58_044307, partial [Brassica napus]
FVHPHHPLYSLSTVSFIPRFFVTKFEATISCMLVQSKYRVEPRGSSPPPPPPPPLCLYIVSLFAVCNDVEFMAEDEMVEIVPNMNMEPLNFIAIPTQVPMWLAVALKRRGKCTFRPPASKFQGEITSRGHKRCPVHKLEINLGSFRGTSAVKRPLKATLRSFDISCANICGASWELRTSTTSISVLIHLSIWDKLMSAISMNT